MALTEQPTARAAAALDDPDLAALIEKASLLKTQAADRNAALRDKDAKLDAATAELRICREQLAVVESERDALRVRVTVLEAQLASVSPPAVEAATSPFAGTTRTDLGSRNPFLQQVSTQELAPSFPSIEPSILPTLAQSEPSTATVTPTSPTLKQSQGVLDLAATAHRSPPPGTDTPATAGHQRNISEASSLDTNAKEFAAALNLVFGDRKISLDFNSSSEDSSDSGDAPATTPTPSVAVESIHPVSVAASQSPPKSADGFLSLALPEFPSSHSRNISLASDAQHSRQTSNTFSFEANADEESAVQWSRHIGRDSTSSIEYVDDYSDQEESNADSNERRPRTASDSEESTPTLKSSPVVYSTQRLRGGDAVEFPARVQSFLPSRYNGVNPNSGLGVSGIPEANFPTATSAPGSAPSTKKDAADSSSNASVTSPESPVYFPSNSPTQPRTVTMSSTLSTSAITPNKSPSTYYDNVQMLETKSLLVTPESLPMVLVFVISSRMRNFHKSKSNKTDDPIIILSVRDRSSEKEWWKVTKSLSALISLDTALRSQLSDFSIPRIPDRSFFASLAPAKVDSRKKMLEDYFSAIMSVPALQGPPAIAFCEFLSSDIIDPMAVSETAIRKHGYLTKRGKNFGGWKVRYFVLDSPEFQYFEGPGGALLGTINLAYADIQDIPRSAVANGDKSYLHAFQILERKRPDLGATRHTFCAESDEERDEWIAALSDFVDPIFAKERQPQENAITSSKSPDLLVPSSKASMSDSASIASVSTMSVGTLSAPGHVSPKKKLVPAALTLPSPMSRKLKMTRDSSTESNLPDNFSEKNKSGLSMNDRSRSPVGTSSSAATTPFSAHFGKLTLPERPSSSSDSLHPEEHIVQDLKKQKKKSIFSLKKDTSVAQESISHPQLLLQDQLRQHQRQQLDNKKFLQLDFDNNMQHSAAMFDYRASLARPLDNLLPPVSPGLRPAFYDNDPKFSGEITRGGVMKENTSMFGAPLAQAVELSYVQKGEVKLPSVVYRCIEYLVAKNALKEEGIFRLSGSSSAMRALKERFSQVGDVDLVHDHTQYDLHAVAGLLKMFLREMPSSVLTKSLENDFLSAVDIADRDERIDKLYNLLRRLPSENFGLLKALSHFLVRVVENQEQNKMSLKNVGIVFAPTLNVSNILVLVFIAEYGSLFVDKS
ncbi:uncharacterized protein V1518DRAFT_416458 [Limtongia smithiae]|uniref:uncharacterized protein n=1 Tax=Limtongia smithiae TaxID=1125753 RepID=UPI0034CDADBD